MKYPFHTQSKPVTGEEARKSIEAGRSVTNELAFADFDGDLPKAGNTDEEVILSRF